MQITGMLHGARMLKFVSFPVTDVLGPGASEEEIMIDLHGQVFIKPVFKGDIGKKGKAGLLGRATDLKTARCRACTILFLYPRMIGCAAEIDDHMNRGRNMDTRTPASQCRFVA